MAKSAKAKGPPLELALERGATFFQKGNFPLAKREFEAALGLGVKEAQAQEIAGKLAVCAREIAVQEGREAVKRARKLEKKGAYRDALEQFEKALAIEQQGWIEERIAALRLALNQAEAASRLEAVAESEDPEERLAALDQALTAGADRAIAEQRANCLVELERFEDALAQYASAPPSSDLSRYRQGYASAALGRYLDALALWQTLADLPPGLAGQVEQLLPCACHELEGTASRADGYAIITEMARRIDPQEKSAEFKAWEQQAACCRLDALWESERYEDMLPLLPPLEQPLNPAALLMHAQVSFKCAERDAEQLESAIALWLTSVYDDSLLDALAVHGVAPAPLERSAVRERLVERLGVLVNSHAKQGRLSSRVLGLWRMETRIIRQLAQLPVQGTPPAGYPCTPGFALRYGLAEGIFAFLKDGPASSTIDLQELRACFGPTGPAMICLETGEEEQALAAIPRGVEDRLARYCRERIALACAMAKARRGEQQIKRHVLDALPLLQAEPQRVQELLELAYANQPSIFFEGLADALEALCARIDHPNLPEATAHTMGIKAVAMLNRGANPAVVQKLLERALAIFPESEMAQSTMESLEERQLGDDIEKAFKRQNPLRAARLARNSKDLHNRDFFFSAMDVWYQQALRMKESAKAVLLDELHESCLMVDPSHPLTSKIANAINEFHDI